MEKNLKKFRTIKNFLMVDSSLIVNLVGIEYLKVKIG